MEIVSGWSAFANGGYKISPYLIQKIEDREGKTLFVANPPTVPANDPNPKAVSEAAISSVDVRSPGNTATDRQRRTERSGCPGRRACTCGGGTDC